MTDTNTFTLALALDRIVGEISSSTLDTYLESEHPELTFACETLDISPLQAALFAVILEKSGDDLAITRDLVNTLSISKIRLLGFKKELEINGVGYRAAKSGNKLTLSLGYSHPVEMIDPEGIESVLEGQNKITVKGIDKEKVGQYAAEIRDKRRPEPYKGKGIKYADEVIRRKVGKTGKK